MRKIFLFFLIVFTPAFGFAAVKKQSLSVSAVVEYILDGDTFAGRVLLSDDVEITIRIRILNIDAPELSGECSAEIKMANIARDRLSELIPAGSVVNLREVKDDKYLGRIDAIVFDKSGRNIGDIMMSEKLVRKYSGGKRESWCE